jgi:hypothetical protein
MSFLAPLFLLGAAAILGPIIFHLIRRTTKDVTPFSTLMFLQPTPPRLTRRSRLENLWLLLFRCLVIALLAIGFGRPFLRSQKAAPLSSGEGKRTLIVIDTSASMRREALWEKARSKAEARIRDLLPNEEVALVAFSRAPRTLLTFEEWRKFSPGEREANAIQRLATLAPDWNATRLDAALLHAAELIENPSKDQPIDREIVVISDFQEGSRIDAMQGYEWPKGLIVTLDAVTSSEAGNAGLNWVAESEESSQTAENPPIRVRVSNSAESKTEQFSIEWAGRPAADTAAKLNLQIPAGQTRTIRAPKQATGGGATSTELILHGDRADFDNHVFILPSQAQNIPILYVGNDADEDTRGSLYYLHRAFPTTRREKIEIIAHRSTEAIPAFQQQQAQFLVMSGNASDPAIATAREFARSGKIVFLPLAATADAKAISTLLEIPPISATEATVKDFALLGEIDFQHPLFAPFADPRFSDFTKIHFWKHRRIDPNEIPGSRILARFDKGDPALLQVPIGSGSVIVLTTTWRPVDGQLALSSKFVPLLHAMLDLSSRLPSAKSQYFVGDEVMLPPATAPFTVRKPGGAEIAAPAASAFTATDEPGIYTVAPIGLRFAVNLPPEESRTSPIPRDRFETLGVPLKREELPPALIAQQQALAQAIEVENQQKLWRWLIAACLGVLLLETFIAWKLSRTTGISSAAQT